MISDHHNFLRPHDAAVGVRTRLIITYDGDASAWYSARSSFRKNFPWLGQWVVERKSRDETRIRLPIWVRGKQIFLSNSFVQQTKLASSVNNLNSVNNQFRTSRSIIRIYPVRRRESSIPVQSFSALGLQRWKRNSLWLETSSVR